MPAAEDIQVVINLSREPWSQSRQRRRHFQSELQEWISVENGSSFRLVFFGDRNEDHSRPHSCVHVGIRQSTTRLCNTRSANQEKKRQPRVFRPEKMAGAKSMQIGSRQLR